MKKLVQINVVCYGSTGRIMCDIAKMANKSGYQTFCFYGRGNPNEELNCIRIGNKWGVYFHVVLTRLFGKHGHGSYFATLKLIHYLKKIKPDVIHLHNLHGYYINLKLLFTYLKDYKGKIVWTLHDCWAFTGHCAHFTAIGCNKWTNHCFQCPQKKEYPKSIIFDTSFQEFNRKKKLFIQLKDMTIVVPSMWLGQLVQKSYLNKYEIKVINNGIDLSLFKPNSSIISFEKFGIPRNRKIILGVASVWSKYKGLAHFLKLSQIIEDDFVIVLVGLKSHQLHGLPPNIIGIQKLDHVEELICLYSCANVFVNPSLEETFSMVTLEAMACGTPVVVSASSAMKELVSKDSGYAIASDNPIEYYDKIKLITKRDKDKIANSLRLKLPRYRLDVVLMEYLKLYKGK